MYKITLVNGQEEILLHHYNNVEDSPKVLKATMKEGINNVPSLTLDLPSNHIAFNKLYPFLSHVKVEDERDNEIFYGRMINPSESLSAGLSKTLIFEGELAYLNDSTVKPKEYHNYSVRQFLTELLEKHNSKVEEYKRFYIGKIEVEENLYRMSNYEKTLPFLIDRLPNRIGGFFVVRKENGIKYIDYLTSIGKQSNQPVKFGVNMLDYQREVDVTSVITRLVPLGAEKEEKTSQVGNKLTIESVNGGKDYLENLEAIKSFGVIESTENWDDVNDPNILKKKGEERLKELSKVKRTLSISSVDLHLLNPNFNSYILGDEVLIQCDPFGVDEFFKIVEVERDLLDPTKDKYTLGNKWETLTNKQLNMQRTQQKIDSFFGEGGLHTNYLQGAIDLLKNNMGAMVQSAEKHNAKAILFEDRIKNSATYGAMAIGTKGFMIAHTMLPDGSDWDWRTFGTGKGFVADLIIAGKILGNNAEFNLDEGFLKVTHTDSSYTKLEAKGLMRYKGGQGKAYHYLNKAGSDEFISNGDKIEYRWVQLDDEFKGKDFNVNLSIATLKAQFYPSMIAGWEIELKQIDKQNARFQYYISYSVVPFKFESKIDSWVLNYGSTSERKASIKITWNVTA